MNEEAEHKVPDKETLESFKQTSRTPYILATLPDYLKDPANYDKVRKAIYEAGTTKHSHSDVGDWAACFVCQRRQMNRVETIKGLGFKSPAHYMVWNKIHEEIKSRRRDPLI